EARPDLALSSDFIVGFPGETDRDFDETMRLVRDVGYAQAYSFKYSPRPGTPAALQPNQVPEEVKAARLAELQNLLAEQQRRFNEGTVGATMPVLLERHGRLPGQLVGRSPYMQSVHVTADDDLLGTIVPVTVVRATPNGLAGRVSGAAPASAQAGLREGSAV